MKLASLHVKNYKAFQDARLENPPSFCVLLGANGSGKTTLFDVFGFLRDSLKNNVRQALQVRGGFSEVVSRGHENETISFELKFLMPLMDKERHVTYLLEIGRSEKGVPLVEREILEYKRARYGSPFHFLDFKQGKGWAVGNEADFNKSDEDLDREWQELDSPDILALKGLGQFQRFMAASALRSLIENWHVSDFHITAARGVKDAGYAEHLSVDGDNLALVAQYLFESHKDSFDHILKKFSASVPGIKGVEAVPTSDGRIVLKFQDGSFKDPFVSRYVSDGTIKMFAYLVLLHDPQPHPLLCVEEPENQLYPSLLGELAEEFQEYARRGGQVLVSTHSPDFIDAVPLDSIYWLEKQNGFTQIFRASDNELLGNLVKEGDLPGRLWNQGMFGKVHPK
ncbi:MAG: AAA family ATPase [Rhodospirillales bacterium]|jgi:predicted ATPase